MPSDHANEMHGPNTQPERNTAQCGPQARLRTEASVVDRFERDEAREAGNKERLDDCPSVVVSRQTTPSVRSRSWASRREALSV